MPTDEKLMHLVQQGDISQLRELFIRHQVKIYNFFLRQGMSKSVSEDLTQNVFERIIKYKDSYKSDYSFKTWMYRIATNIQYDQRQLLKKEATNELNIDVSDEFNGNPHSLLEGEEKVLALHRAMNQLNIQDQQLIFLSKSEKLKYSEIAVIMNSTEGAIKVKVHRALKSLRIAYINFEK